SPPGTYGSPTWSTTAPCPPSRSPPRPLPSTWTGTRSSRHRPTSSHARSSMPCSELSHPPGSTASGPSPDYLRLLLSDGRLPTGAHTQSGGVEPAFAAGMRLEQVPDYLRLRLRTVTEVEAATSVVARHLWLTN